MEWSDQAALTDTRIPLVEVTATDVGDEEPELEVDDDLSKAKRLTVSSIPLMTTVSQVRRSAGELSCTRIKRIWLELSLGSLGLSGPSLCRWDRWLRLIAAQRKSLMWELLCTLARTRMATSAASQRAAPQRSALQCCM